MLSASPDPCTRSLACPCTNPTLGKGSPLSSTFSHSLSGAHGRVLFPEQHPLAVLHISINHAVGCQSGPTAMELSPTTKLLYACF